MRLRLIPAFALVLFAAAGCLAPGKTGGSPTSEPPGTPTTTATTTIGVDPGSAPPPPTSEPPGDGVEYRVTYPFAVPSSPVTMSQPWTPPIADPPAPPLPYLVGVYVGNH